MEILAVILLAAVPICWLVAEVRARAPLRIGLGIASIAATAVAMYGLVSVLTKFNYNARYGVATKKLIESTIQQVEDGRTERVLKVLRALHEQYRPTYENRANYEVLVTEATSRMRGEIAVETNAIWNAPRFNAEDWLGHWENDTGYWIVINDVGKPLDVVRSGDPPTKMHSVELSADGRTLKFSEGERWRHTVIRIDKYQASHEWFNLTEKSVWQTDRLHRLLRASPDVRAAAQQKSP